MTCEQHHIVEEMHSDVQEIKSALLGTFDRPGLVAKVNRYGDELAALRAMQRAVTGLVWKILAGAVAGGGIVTVTIDGIGKLLK